MKRTPRVREDLSELPDWLRKRTCPHKDKYLSGRRILPKGVTGREKLFPAGANMTDHSQRSGASTNAA